MCVVFVAYKVLPQAPLVLFQNRDEFYKRGFQPVAEWEGESRVIAPKDLPSQGTWMGMTREGRFATITNIRDPKKHKAIASSRGKIVLDFLNSTQSPSEFIDDLRPRLQDFNGFNLIFGAVDDLHYFSSRSGKIERLEPGYYGLSNADLNTPWPKVRRGLQVLKAMKVSTLPEGLVNLQETALQLLHDKTLASNDDLPQTGLPFEWESKLSSIYVEVSDYGTVASSILVVASNGNVEWLDHYSGPQVDRDCRTRLVQLTLSRPIQ